MRVLVACEFSGIVRDAFASRGHDAWSCDLIDSERPGRHVRGDVLNILGDGWDLMVAHPPCTYLSNAARRVWNTPGREEKRKMALNFFLTLYNAPIPQIAIENPVGVPCWEFRKPDQIIHPYYFGCPKMKRICLWFRGVKPLQYSLTDSLWGTATACTKPPYFWPNKTGKERSRFFPEIADAMAKQWG